MSQQTTIRKLAALVNTPVEKLLEQLSEAGMKFSDPDQVVTSTEKVKLLGFLRRTHGRAEKAAEDPVAPKKITLQRKSTLTVGGGRNKPTVDVVVRKKVTLKPEDAAAGARSGGGVDDERAEILRKLEESRQRNLDEQQRLAEADRRRVEEAEAAKRLVAEQEADRVRKEAAATASAVEETPRKAHGHGHPKPAVPPRDDRAANKGKPNRGSHAMVAGVEDDDSAARFAGQLHLSPADRARRGAGASRSKGRQQQRGRQPDQARTGTGFTRPTAPVVREVAIGEAITVADLA